MRSSYNSKYSRPSPATSSYRTNNAQPPSDAKSTSSTYRSSYSRSATISAPDSTSSYRDKNISSLNTSQRRSDYSRYARATGSIDTRSSKEHGYKSSDYKAGENNNPERRTFSNSSRVTSYTVPTRFSKYGNVGSSGRIPSSSYSFDRSEYNRRTTVESRFLSSNAKDQSTDDKENVGRGVAGSYREARREQPTASLTTGNQNTNFVSTATNFDHLLWNRFPGSTPRKVEDEWSSHYKRKLEDPVAPFEMSRLNRRDLATRQDEIIVPKVNKIMGINDMPLTLFHRIMYEAENRWTSRIRFDVVCRHWRNSLPFYDARHIVITESTPDPISTLCSQLSHGSSYVITVSVTNSELSLIPDVFDLLSDCERLISLELRVRKADLSLLPALSRLEFLHLDVSEPVEKNPDCAQLFCDQISSMSALESLVLTLREGIPLRISNGSLKRVKVGSHQFRSSELETLINGCPVLEELSLNACRVLRGISSERLTHAQNLTKLALDDCRLLNDADLCALASATPNLTELSAYGCPEIETYECLLLWSALEVLHIDDLAGPSVAIEAGDDFGNWFGGMIETNIDWELFFDSFPTDCRIKDFSYMGSALNDIMLGVLATKCPKLESIYIFNWGPLAISAGGVMFIVSVLKSLKRLLIPYSSLGDEIFVTLLDEANCLETVAIQAAGCTETGLTEFLQERARKIRDRLLPDKTLTVRLSGFGGILDELQPMLEEAKVILST